MATEFEHKPGSFSLFKNTFKEKDTQPDYKGDGKDLDGNDIEISAWLKDGKNGKFMSCKISPPFKKAEAKPSAKPAAPDDLDSDIPF